MLCTIRGLIEKAWGEVAFVWARVAKSQRRERHRDEDKMHHNTSSFEISLKRCSDLNLLCCEAGITFAPGTRLWLINRLEHNRDACRSGRWDVQMVVGRTLWDLLWEVIQNPRLRISFLVVLILLEVALIILALLIHSGLLTMKFSLGGFEVDVHP